MTLPGQHAVVLDSSVVIHLKREVPVTEQWEFFTLLGDLVDRGLVGWPKYVRKEIIGGQYPDTPGSWIGARKHQPFPEPAIEYVVEALDAARLVDAEAEGEVADPYVVAMALERREQWPERIVVVASDDVVDRLPQKESIKTACERLGLPLWSCADLVGWVRSA